MSSNKHCPSYVEDYLKWNLPSRLNHPFTQVILFKYSIVKDQFTVQAKPENKRFAFTGQGKKNKKIR